jgi:hypothetical protein
MPFQPLAETPVQKIIRLSAMLIPGDLDGTPIGVAECGCPNNAMGAPPTLHICSACGLEGSDYEIHVRDATCPMRGAK